MNHEYIVSNKYQKVYSLLVEDRKTLQRNQKDSYFECHHVLPRSFGGNNEPENLVLLTAREHFLAHWLLTKFTVGEGYWKMLCAFLKMYNISKDVSGRKDTKYKKSGRVYEKLRIAYSESMKGRTHSEEAKRKMSEARKGRVAWNKGLSKETDERLAKYGETYSKKYKGTRKLSEEQKKKIK